MIDRLALSDWLVVVALALPHLMYAFIWYFPDTWMSWFKKKSVQVFETIAWVLKGVQFTSVAAWYLLHHPAGVQLGNFTPLTTLLSLVLVGCGQTLNAGIFQAIGHAGVYYGYKLGHKIPWVEGFPFNVVSHPQYVGSVMTIWGAAVLLWSQSPPGFGWLVSYWTGLYLITGCMESFTT